MAALMLPSAVLTHLKADVRAEAGPEPVLITARWHPAAVTALKQVDAEFEAVSASLKVPIWRTFLRVTVPVCLPAILDSAIYYFVNAMTTVSAVIFIYTGPTKFMAINALNTDDAGNSAAACAMGMTIVLTCALVRGLYALAGRTFLARHHAWRKRSV